MSDICRGLAMVSVAWSLVLGAGVENPALGQEADSRGGAGLLETYLALVDTYHAGEFSGPTRALSAWSEGRAVDLVTELIASPDGPADAFGDERRLVAAAFLHTQVGFLLLNRGGMREARPHLELARDLLHSAPAEPGDLARRWRLAVGCRLRTGFYLSEAQIFLEDEDVTEREDAPSLLALGSIHDFRSTYRNPVCPSRHDCPNAPTRRDYDRAEAERAKTMQNALGCYFRALELAPWNAEARLRVGRILARLGRVTEARRHLRRLVEAPTKPRTAYLAHLFLGQTHERAGELAPAIEQYRLAVETLPRASVGRMALGFALRSGGDRAGERLALLPLVGKDVRPTDPLDPWWVYATRPEPCRESLWRELRMEALH